MTQKERIKRNRIALHVVRMFLTLVLCIGASIMAAPYLGSAPYWISAGLTALIGVLSWEVADRVGLWVTNTGE